MKRAKRKRASLLEAEKQMEDLLKRVGYTGKFKGKPVNSIPSYKVESNVPKTSDKICDNGSKKKINRYTGTEIIGISIMHKSNLQPVTSREQAIDASQMRRN